MPTNIYESVKKAFQDIVAPELRALQVEIKRLDEKIDVGLGRLDEKIENVNEKITNLRDDIRSLKEEFRLAIDMHERIATLEAKIGH